MSECKHGRPEIWGCLACRETVNDDVKYLMTKVKALSERVDAIQNAQELLIERLDDNMKAIKKPHQCPLCEGYGLFENGNRCHSCKGEGIVWG